jgi:hypothetical protein
VKVVAVQNFFLGSIDGVVERLSVNLADDIE